MQKIKTTRENSKWTSLKINLNLILSTYFLFEWTRSLYNGLVSRNRYLKGIDLLNLRENSVFGGYLEITIPPWVRHMGIWHRSHSN